MFEFHSKKRNALFVLGTLHMNTKCYVEQRRLFRQRHRIMFVNCDTVHFSPVPSALAFTLLSCCLSRFWTCACVVRVNAVKPFLHFLSQTVSQSFKHLLVVPVHICEHNKVTKRDLLLFTLVSFLGPRPLVHFLQRAGELRSYFL